MLRGKLPLICISGTLSLVSCRADVESSSTIEAKSAKANPTEKQPLGLLGAPLAAGQATWPNMVVRYSLAPNLDPIVGRVVRASAQEYMQKTPLIFEEVAHVQSEDMTSETPSRIVISHHNDPNDIICAGGNTVSLTVKPAGSPCINEEPFFRAKITHELGHGLGLVHETSHPERDTVIAMNVSNHLTTGSAEVLGMVRFLTGPASVGFPTTGRFDPSSIMSYPPYFLVGQQNHIPNWYTREGSNPQAGIYNVDFSNFEISAGDRLGISQIYRNEGAPIISDIGDVSMELNATRNVEFDISVVGGNVSCANNVKIGPLDSNVLSASVSEVTASRCRLALTSKGKTGYAEVAVFLQKFPQNTQRPQASSDLFLVRVGNPQTTPSSIFLSKQNFPANLRSEGLVAEVSVTDADPGEKHVLRLAGPDANAFVVLGKYLFAANPLGREKYNVTLIARDRAGLTKSVDVELCRNGVACTAQSGTPPPATSTTTASAASTGSTTAASTGSTTAASTGSTTAASTGPTTNTETTARTASAAASGSSPNSSAQNTSAANKQNLALNFSEIGLSADRTDVPAPSWVNFRAVFPANKEQAVESIEWLADNLPPFKVNKISRYFPEPGSYVVKVRVKDKAGNTHTKSITIEIK